MSACFCKKLAFFGKNSTFTQTNNLRAVLEILLVLFSLFVRCKVIYDENVSFTEYAPGFQLPDCSKLAKNWKNDNIVIIFWHDVIAEFFWHCFLSLLSSLVTDPSFMSISSLVLELWQFSFIRDWPEIRKSEIPPSVFCPIIEDWDE